MTKALWLAFESVFNLQDFGANPAASAETNTRAIQDCLSVVPATGGTIFVPPGVYRHNAITVTNRRNLRMVGVPTRLTSVGEETGSMFKNISTGVGWTFRSASDAAESRGVVLEGLVFKGSGRSSHGIELERVCYYTFRDTYIIGNTATGKAGLFLDRVSSVMLSGVHIETNDHGVLSDVRTGSPFCNHVTVVGGEIRGNSTKGVELSGQSLGFFGVNLEEQPKGICIGVQPSSRTSRGISIVGCYFENNRMLAIELGQVASVRGFIVQGCYVTLNAGKPTNVVSVVGANGTIDGNQFEGLAIPRNVIRIENSSHVRVGTNGSVTEAGIHDAGGNSNIVFDDGGLPRYYNSTGRGQGVISDSATSFTHRFAVSRPDANYHVLLTPVAETGGAAVGSNRVSRVAKSAGGFTAHVEMAPGPGKSITFDWQLTG